MLDVEQCERSDRLLREFSPENVLYRGEAFKGGPAGQLLHGIIDLYDSDGQSIKEPINDLIASLTLDNQSLQSNVNLIKQPNGSIQVRYMARKSGNWTLAVTDTTNQHIRGVCGAIEGYIHGTEGLSVYITGSGKVINVLDLHNGTVSDILTLLLVQDHLLYQRITSSQSSQRKVVW
eukprot:XP_763112.1 hypothetical protein [Theileria parva strain Muguga]